MSQLYSIGRSFRLCYIQTLGSHEFDNGVSGLLSPFLENATFPVLSANINTTQAPELGAILMPYHVFNISGELVAVIGYTSDLTRNTVPPGKLTRAI